MMAGLSAVA